MNEVMEHREKILNKKLSAKIAEIEVSFKSKVEHKDKEITKMKKELQV